MGTVKGLEHFGIGLESRGTVTGLEHFGTVSMFLATVIGLGALEEPKIIGIVTGLAHLRGGTGLETLLISTELGLSASTIGQGLLERHTGLGLLGTSTGPLDFPGAETGLGLWPTVPGHEPVATGLGLLVIDGDVELLIAGVLTAAT